MAWVNLIESLRMEAGKYVGRVLVVDDERDITAVLEDVLEGKGYSTIAAHNAQDAIELFAREKFDIVITDLKMPGKSGLDLLAAVKDQNPDTIVIIMTGYATVETAIDALKKGAYDYILKPFKISELLKIVERAFEKILLATENMQLKEQVALLELSEAVSSSLSLNDILLMVVKAAQRELDADGIELLFRQPGSSEFARRVSAGICASKERFVANTALLEAKVRESNAVQWRGDELTTILNGGAPQLPEGTMLSVPLRRGSELLGVLNAVATSSNRYFLPREEKALFVLGDRAATSIENALLYADLEATFKETIKSLALALEAKDAYTHGHSENVTRLSARTAKEMGCSQDFVETITQAGILHDIGKIGISGAILNKPSKLTPAEHSIIQSHPQMGKRILENISFLGEVVPIVYHHHERFDGSGYPEGLSGEDIPLGARIMQVADTYDAMTSNRPYRNGLSHEAARDEILRCRGTQLDPQCVDAFMRMWEKENAE
ncbi:MAG: hypothetical protein C0608_11540 [Deltaproteobacteria bacterium]|nr:MAG: hypothetical protein C0608_11540 [Deltaproteobacteria bacterium]